MNGGGRKPVRPGSGTQELEQLGKLLRVRREIKQLHEKRVDDARRPPPASSPGLPRSSYCNPRSYVVSADLVELGAALKLQHRAELEQLRKQLRRRAVKLGPTALIIATVINAFRGARRGTSGCGVQAPLEAWARVTGSSRRQCAYAFKQLLRAGWVSRRRRLVRHEWTDSNGHTWQRADVHAAAYLHDAGAVALARVGHTRRAGKLVRVGVVGRLLAAAAQKLRAVFLRVSAAEFVARPPTEYSEAKALEPKKARRALCAPLTGPPSHGPPDVVGRQRSAERDRGGPQGGEVLTAQQLLELGSAERAWPDDWAAGDDRKRRWLLEQYVLQTTGAAHTAKQLSAAQRAARREFVRRTGIRRGERELVRSKAAGDAVRAEKERAASLFFRDGRAEQLEREYVDREEVRSPRRRRR